MRCGIIGYGRFGKLWAKCLVDIGQEVLVYDKKVKSRKYKVKRVKFVSLSEVVGADLLFLLVPISEIENVCKVVADKIGKNTIVVDTCSVKMFPTRIMKKYLPARQAIIATHPLFGPDSVSRLGLKGQKIVLCPLRVNNLQLKQFEFLLSKMKLIIIKTTPVRHDKEMARSQALVHFIGRGLERLNLKDQLIATPDYKALLKMNEMVQNDTWQLFTDLQAMNPYTVRVRGRLLAALAEVEKKINGQIDNLPSWRREIEQIDAEIVALLGRRLSIARKIGKIKQAKGLAVWDRKREKQLKQNHLLAGRRLGVGKLLIEKIFIILIKESRKAQR